MQKGINFNYNQLVDFNLQRLLDVFSYLDNIHNKLSGVIHIAGTNGKGSTTAFIKYILQQCGYSVNVFTSPHLVHFNERIYLKTQFISNNYLQQLHKKLQTIPGSNNLSLFEATFVMAVMAFYENKADFNILEVGLGGRLDATNVVNNTLVSAIAHIDYDHEQFLGNTLTKIALEKAYIIKPNSVVVKSYQSKKVMEVFNNFAKKQNSKIIMQQTDYYIKRNVLYYKDYKIPLILGLAGKHQLNNASLAIVSVINAMLIAKKNFSISSIQTAIANTKWPGRLQTISNIYNYNGKVYLDGAHNVNGIKTLNKFIYSEYKKYNSINLIVGILKKKDLHKMLFAISVLQKQIYSKDITKKINIYPTIIQNNDCYTVQEILNSCIDNKLSCIPSKQQNFNLIMQEHFSYIANNYADKSLVIICGSLYLVGDILKNFENTNKFFGN